MISSDKYLDHINVEEITKTIKSKTISIYTVLYPTILTCRVFMPLIFKIVQL